ncbi:MAG: methyl-accepting chemotaxis protein [Pseudomonadota bacterium]
MRNANLKVGTRLAIGFAMLIVGLIIVTIVGLVKMATIEQDLEDIVYVNNVEAKLATSMRVTVFDRMLALRNLVLLTDAVEKEPEAERMKEQAAKYLDSETKLNQMFAKRASSSAEAQAMMVRIKEQDAAAQPIMAKAMELATANKNEEATKVLIVELRPVQRKWMDALNELINKEDALITLAAADARTHYESARTLMLSVAALALLLGIVAAIVISRGLLKQLGGEPDYAAAIAGSIAGGDLSIAVNLKPNDHGSMLFAMKTMRDNLSGIVTQVRTGTDTIATASSQIAAGNLDLSSRTEEQASSLEETASSMEELTSTVKQNADNARQANSLAMTASDVARKGGAVVAEVVGTMSAINESSRKIVDIIAVIDGIAFQTNILALNAAVEAARAGEQGRGFAVVASEVRNLAQRSAAAAKEIKTLIGDSVEKVDVGAKLVDQAGATMNEIVDSVKRVTDIMGEITAASQEQTAGIEQINTAITQMDEVTQQNAALVEEAAAAAESLQDQAANLSQVVSIFKTGNGSGQTLQVGSAATPRAKEKTAIAQRLKKPMLANNATGSSGGRAVSKPTPSKQAVSATASSGGDWEEF